MGTFLGVPIVRIIVYWRYIWAALISGSYHITPSTRHVQCSNQEHISSK